VERGVQGAHVAIAPFLIKTFAFSHFEHSVQKNTPVTLFFGTEGSKWDEAKVVIKNGAIATDAPCTPFSGLFQLHDKK
jgi:hypothetical protein